MKKMLFFAVLLLIISFNALQAQHSVYVEVRNSLGDAPQEGDVNFSAYITSRPEEVLTIDNVGCFYLYFPDQDPPIGLIQVECGNFPTSWSPGDSVHIDATEISSGETGSGEFVLTIAGFDYYAYPDYIQLEEGLPRPLNFNGSVEDTDVHLTWDAPTTLNVDNFVHIKKKSLHNSTERDLLGYNVYRDGVQINTEVVTETEYDDFDLTPGYYSYSVTAVYDEGESYPAGPIEVQILGWGIISGTVTDDDTGDAIEGANIIAGEYSTTSAADGTYSMDVLEGNYDVTCTLDPYIPQTVNVDIGVGEEVTVDFAMFNEVDSPYGVEAIEHTDHSAVDVSWNAPGGGVTTEFRYDDGTATGQLGTQGTTAMLGAAHYHHAILNEISWYTTAEGGPHSSINFYILGLAEDGTPDINNVLFEGLNLPGVDDQWNVYTLPEPVEAVDGFYLGYNFAGFDGLGTDDGVGDPYPYIENTQWVNTDYTAGNDWITAGSAGFPYNFTIRANGLDLGEVRNAGNNTLYPNKAQCAEFSAGSSFEPRNIGNPVYTFVQSNTLTRDIENYQLYRLLDGEQGNEENWNLISDAITDTFYTDESWDSVSPGIYLWAVKAVYTGNIVSDAAFSNTIPSGMSAEVTVNVTTNSGDDPVGASVTLTNDDGDPDHIYMMNAPNGGITVFPDVWLGTYSLQVTLAGYTSYSQTGIAINDDVSLDAELTEMLIPPSSLEVTHEGQNVTLTWGAPGTGVGFVEDFEGGVLPEGWTMTTNSAQGWFITQDGSSEYFAIPTHTWYACSNDDMANDDGSVDYLITPPQDLSYASGISISFQSFFNGSYTQTAILEVSEDGGNSWTPVQDIESNDAWIEVTVDLSDYCGTGHDNVLIGFHSNDNGAWASGWAVDDIVLGDGGANRELLGYNVYRNEDPTPLNATPITETTYNDPNAPVGTYRYDVTAVYTTGESEAAVWTGDVEAGNDIPSKTFLGFNSPNPIVSQTTIKFALRQDANVSLDIYNTKGQKVRTLVNDKMEAGNHSVIWNAKDNSGKRVSSGIYFYKMKSGKYTATKKMILMK